MGHRGIEATGSNINELFAWDGMSRDVEAFVGGCIHLIVSRAGQKIPRPLASALQDQDQEKLYTWIFCTWVRVLRINSLS